jgi:YD repeat-containing protein
MALTGSTYIVAQDSSALGAGWTFAGVDQLVSIAADANGPAGMLRVYGTGGWRFYQGTTTFTGPDGDNGTLSLSGGTYTYSTPDGQSWTFNSSGYLTQWASADGKETLQYRYDGSNRLSGITAIDGGLTTFTYTGSSSVSIQTVNSRTTTLTLSSGDLTKVTNPDGGLHSFTYSSHRVTNEQFGGLENNWAYTSAGTVGTFTWGATTVGGVTNTSRTTYLPAVTRGLSAPVSGTAFASSTDPTSHTEKAELDSSGRTLQDVAPDGGTSTYTYSSGFLATETDPLGRTTSYARDASQYVTRTTLPDGSVVTYQYQSSFHALTTLVNERGYNTTFAYDGSGHLTRETDALGNATTYTYNSTSGLLETVQDARGDTTTFAYDGSRRLTRTIDALGNGTRRSSPC